MDHTRRVSPFPSSAYASGCCLLAICLIAQNSRAEEPRVATEPYLMGEPAEVTQVADAFDKDDPIDVNLSIGYQYSQESASIAREVAGQTSTVNFAHYSESTHRLLTRADIGLYHDIALVIRMPVILANDRSLDGAGSADDQNKGTRGATTDGSTPLFSVPFKSPTRSGVEYLALGLDFGILNQYRDASKPTWVFGFETRFDVSTPMHACNANPAAGQVSCADPGDVNRNGQYDSNTNASGVQLENSAVASRGKGVSRGTTGLEVHTYISKRIKYIEPYGGLKILAEFPTGKSDFGLIDFQSSLVNTPPLEGTLIVGMAVIPWEDRTAYQRATVDFRFASTYRSEGRDYSPLYDALGSSAAPSMRTPLWSEYQAGPNGSSVVNTDSRRVYFNGLSDVQQHLKNRLSAEFTYQAAKFIKLGVGLGYTVIQSHFITYDQACNANFTDNSNKSGPCRKDALTQAGTTTQTDYTVTGVPNPNYRPAINSSGNRYRVEDSGLLDGWLHATVMF